MEIILIITFFAFLSDYGKPEYTIHFDKEKVYMNEKIQERAGKYSKINIDPFSAEAVSCFEKKTRTVKLIAVPWTINDKVKCQNGWN